MRPETACPPPPRRSPCACGRSCTPGKSPPATRRLDTSGVAAWRCYDLTMKPSESILFSGGAPGAEAEFGACAERHGIEEVNFTFEGHNIQRHRGVRMLNLEELQA